jgi:hypothetical protein
MDQYIRTNKMHCLLSVYYDKKSVHVSSTYLLIIRRYCIYEQQLVYFVCVLCRLAAGSVGVELASREYAHKIYQLLCIQCLLMMSKYVLETCRGY